MNKMYSLSKRGAKGLLRSINVNIVANAIMFIKNEQRSTNVVAPKDFKFDR